ncbi:hypothetical protein Tco_0019925 [Tanacetum coccineum]
MSVSHIFVLSRSDDTSTRSSIPYIILTDLEAEDATVPAAPAPLSPDYVLHHNGPLMMLTLWKGVRSPFTLSSAIEVAIAKEIAAPPRKRARLTPSAASPSSPQSLPSHLMTLPHTEAIEETTNEATTETTIPTRHCKKSQARIWINLIPIFRIWRDQEGAPSTYEIVESFIAHVLPVTGDSSHYTVPLLVARLILHKGLIEAIHDHLREIPLERVKTLKQEVETLHDRDEAAEQRTEVLLDFSRRARE